MLGKLNNLAFELPHFQKEQIILAGSNAPVMTSKSAFDSFEVNIRVHLLPTLFFSVSTLCLLHDTNASVHLRNTVLSLC